MSAFDPMHPQNGDEADADFLRSQFNALKDLIAAVPAGAPGPQGPPGADGAPGPQGPQGPQGNDGLHVVGVSDNGSGQATIQMSDTTTYGPFTVASGPAGMQGPQGNDGGQGPQGNDGAQGPQGPQGADGVYVTGINSDGMGQAYLQMSDGSTYGPFTVATGPQGPQGNDGPQGPQGEVSASDMNNAIAMAIGGASNNSNGVEQLNMTVSDPPTQSEMQAIANKLDELIAALRRA